MSLYRDIAKELARAAVLNEEDGDNVSVTIPIDAWRQFWTALGSLDSVEKPPYSTTGEYMRNIGDPR